MRAIKFGLRAGCYPHIYSFLQTKRSENQIGTAGPCFDACSRWLTLYHSISSHQSGEVIFPVKHFKQSRSWGQDASATGRKPAASDPLLPD